MYFDIITFGCKLNQAESEKMSADLNSIGLIKNNIKPDLIIVNACAVTHKATREGRQKISQLKRKYPQVKIIVTGCVEDRSWSGVDEWVKKEFILKPHFFQKMIEKDFIVKNNTNYGISRQAHYNLFKTRALIKIQTGCNNFCSYCIVPLTRGHNLINTPNKEIINKILEKEKQGFKEIILTGVNIGLYGLGVKKLATNQNINLIKLLKDILKQTNIYRIRLGSIWPTHITADLIKLYAHEPRLCPHFHLSIQSGSNKVLKLMNRHYTIGRVKTIIKKCQIYIPYINLTTDIIVGFPGETEQDFQASLKLIQEISFSKVHIFKYSQRLGTHAITMPNQVDEKIKNERSQQLIKLAEQVAQQTKQKFFNIELPVLWEHRQVGYYYGFTSNYIRVKKKTRPRYGLKNQLEVIKLTKNLLA